MKILSWSRCVCVDHLIKIANFPEEDEQFLMVLDFFIGIRQICLNQRIFKKTGESMQHEGKIFFAMNTR